MSIALRVAFQLVSTKEGRSLIVKIVLAIVALIAIPCMLIGGASTSILGYVSNDSDVFAEAKNEVKQELKIQNDMDVIFIRYLYSDSVDVPDKQSLIWIIKIFFLNRFDDPNIQERILALQETLAVAPAEEREQILNQLNELRTLADQFARYEFKNREDILFLFENPDSDFTADQIAELKWFLSLIDEVNAGEGLSNLGNASSPLKMA